MKAAEEKAKELVRKFWLQGIEIPDSKKCALICVDEILNILPLPNRDYWQEVKQKINEL